MSNLELRIEEEASLDLTLGESSDMSFDAVDFVGVPFSPTVEVENIEGGHRVSITSMGAEGKKTDEFDVMDGVDGTDGATGPTGPQGPAGEDYVITSEDYAEIAAQVETNIAPTIEEAQQATQDATDAAALATRAAANLWNAGNVLFGELSESTVLTTDDAFAAPPKSVEVFGKSTQVQTTGKNLLSDVESDWQKLTIPDVATRWVWFIPVDEGASYTYSRNATGTAGFFLGWADDTSFANYEAIVTLTNYATYTVTNTTHSYLVVSIASSNTTAQIADTIKTRECQIEQASAKTAYEPWSGKTASPRPDWPQEIKSVDSLALWLTGKNLLDTSSLVDGKYIGSTGSIGSDASMNYTENYSPIAEGTYTISLARGDASKTIRLHGYDSSKNWVTQVWSSTVDTGSSAFVSAVTVPAGINYLRLSFASSMSQVQLEAGATATAYTPYVTPTSVTIPLSDHIARSLPDGTRDTLTLTYQGPSTREGWGVFGKTLVQRVIEYTFKGNESILAYNWKPSSGTYSVGFSSSMLSEHPKPIGYNNVQMEELTTKQYIEVGDAGEIGLTGNNVNTTAYSVFVRLPSSIANSGDTLLQWIAGKNLYYAVDTPITHDLGTVELPINPAPDLTAWADGGSAQPNMSMVYEQDINIVIGRLRDAIADMATS